jgi:hypothetical protein
MSPAFPWASVLMFTGALQGLLLFAALLWRKPRRSTANRILAVLMFLTAIRLGHVAIIRLQPAPVAWDWSLPGRLPPPHPRPSPPTRPRIPRGAVGRR